jgi:hypothetical protein
MHELASHRRAIVNDPVSADARLKIGSPHPFGSPCGLPDPDNSTPFHRVRMIDRLP